MDVGPLRGAASPRSNGDVRESDDIARMTEFSVVAGVVDRGIEWVRLGLDAVGGLVIGIGAIVTIATLARDTSRNQPQSFTSARLLLARYLALALEFQLAADVLETAIAPEWTKLGQLAAIAAIRTALNYFLSREMREERDAVAPPRTPAPPTATAR